MEIMLHPRYTFESMGQTFQAIQLLVQTISNTMQQDYRFVPISQNNKIQETVKIVYNYIKENQLQIDFENELHNLFKAITLKGHVTYIIICKAMMNQCIRDSKLV